MAWNGTVAPTAADGVAGVTAMDASVAAVTVSAVLPDTLPEAAEIVVLPTARADARPKALIVAVDVVPEVHVTVPEMSFVLLSEYVPVAWNCTPVPAAAGGFKGVTAMDFNVAAVMVRVVLPDMLPDVAEIVVL